MRFSSCSVPPGAAGLQIMYCTLASAAWRTGMDAKTARDYRDNRKLPSARRAAPSGGNCRGPTSPEAIRSRGVAGGREATRSRAATARQDALRLAAPRTLRPVTIAGQSFDHLVYHFVLTYSNWE